MSDVSTKTKAPAERTLNDIVCYILCSKCKTGLRRAKIRVRCAECRREPIILSDTQHFPGTWLELKKLEFRGWCPDDLATRGRGKGCGYGKQAQFFMKCSYFNEKTQERCDSTDILYLDQVKDPPNGSWAVGCVACLRKTGPMVVFDTCECMLCALPVSSGEKSCFAAYCKSVIETGFVSLIPDDRTGYISFGCPSYFQGGKHEKSLVRDVHHLKLAGNDIYSRYKEIAASRVTDTTCPWCLCGLVKMQWTEYNEKPHRIICPNSACRKGFCSGRECGAKWPEGAEHKCDTRDSEYVRRIAKPCPTKGCRQLHVHYFRHDCHHIGMKGGCPGCGVHFCYICGRIRPECATECSHQNSCECPLWCDPENTCGCPRCPGCAQFGGACATHKECRSYCRCAKSEPTKKAVQGAIEASPSSAPLPGGGSAITIEPFAPTEPTPGKPSAPVATPDVGKPGVPTRVDEAPRQPDAITGKYMGGVPSEPEQPNSDNPQHLSSAPAAPEEVVTAPSAERKPTRTKKGTPKGAAKDGKDGFKRKDGFTQDGRLKDGSRGPPAEELYAIASRDELVLLKELQRFLAGKATLLADIAKQEALFAERQRMISTLRASADIALAQRAADEASARCDLLELDLREQAKAEELVKAMPAKHRIDVENWRRAVSKAGIEATQNLEAIFGGLNVGTSVT